MRALLLFPLLLLVLPPARGSALPVAGAWEGPLGVLRLEEGAGGITGTLLVPRPGIALPEGAAVLRGSSAGDALSAEIRLPLSGCKQRDAWAPGLLLLAMKNNLLSGALTISEPGCTPRAVGPNGGFAMRRVPDDAVEETLAEARAARDAIAHAAAKESTPPPAAGVAAAAAATPAADGGTAAPAVRRPPVKAKGGVVAGKIARIALAPRVADDKADEARMGDEAVWVANQDLRPLGEIERSEVDDPGIRKLRRARAQTVMRDGENYMNEGRFEQARERFLDAIQQDPSVAEAYNGVGVTYYARNQHDDALAWYKRALSVDPDFGDAYYNIACLHSVKGSREDAFRFLALAVRNGYTADAALDQDHDLDPIRKDPRFARLRAEKQKKGGKR